MSNDVHAWRYEKICDLLGGGVGYRIATHSAPVKALETAIADKTRPHVLNVLLDPADRSPAMTCLTRRLAKRLSGAKL